MLNLAIIINETLFHHNHNTRLAPPITTSPMSAATTCNHYWWPTTIIACRTMTRMTWQHHISQRLNECPPGPCNMTMTMQHHLTVMMHITVHSCLSPGESAWPRPPIPFCDAEPRCHITAPTAHPTFSFDIESRCHMTVSNMATKQWTMTHSSFIIVIHLMTHWWAPPSQPTSLTCLPQITWHNDDATPQWRQWTVKRLTQQHPMTWQKEGGITLTYIAQNDLFADALQA